MYNTFVKIELNNKTPHTMKILLLTAAFLCLFTSLSFAQFQMDVSSGITYIKTDLSGGANGFYTSVAPSISLKGKLRLRSRIQYRKLVNERLNDNGNIDLSPEIEYDIFNFLSIGGGFYYSFNLNSLFTNGSIATPELGPVGLVKFKRKDAFATIRFSKPIADEIRDVFDAESSLQETTYFPGFFQFGLGYTFGRK